MAVLSKKAGEFTTLDFQLKTTWDETTEAETLTCIDNAIEGCRVVCSVIAPNAGEELYNHSFRYQRPISHPAN